MQGEALRPFCIPRYSAKQASLRPPASQPWSGTQTPTPDPKSQSFSRSYGSILPTSLTYIVLSTRGCSPWRPAAVISTTRNENYSLPRIFKGFQERTGHHQKCDALPNIVPYLRIIRFQGAPLVKKKRELFPGLLPASPSSVALPHRVLHAVKFYPHPGSGILTRFPFDVGGAGKCAL